MDILPNSHAERPILVIGSTGKTGRRVAQRLGDRGIHVLATSRTGKPPFDWRDRNTWSEVLQGVSAAYVTYQPDLLVPNAPNDIAHFAEQALEAGVERIVLLSGRGEEGARRSEEALQNAGIPWTILRASWFCQNFSESFLAEAVTAGEVALPVADVPEPFVDADDIAEVAIEALLDDAHAGAIYELTGPRALTFAEAVNEIAMVTNHTVRFRRMSMDAFLAELRSQGVPHDIQAVMRELFAHVLDGRNTQIKEGVLQVLGRQPHDFSEYVRKTARSGVWSAAP